MNEKRTDLPKIGVLHALGAFTLRDMAWPEGLPCLVIGVGGAWWTLTATAVDERVQASGDVLVLAAAMLSVVFAALAIIVSIPSQGYMRLLQEGRQGVLAFMNPFLFAVGLQVALVLLAFAYRLSGSHLPERAENVLFCLLGGLLVFGLLDLVSLARQLVKHAFLRAELAMVDGEDENGNVRQMPRRSQP